MVHLFPQTWSQEPEWKLILHFSVCSQVLQGSDSRPAEEAVVACGALCTMSKATFSLQWL